LEVEDVGIFYGHLVFFTAIWYITYMASWYIFMVIWDIIYVSRFGRLSVQIKNLATLLQSAKMTQRRPLASGLDSVTRLGQEFSPLGK
jgi:hypothetical protein